MLVIGKLPGYLHISNYCLMIGSLDKYLTVFKLGCDVRLVFMYFERNISCNIYIELCTKVELVYGTKYEAGTGR